MAIRIIADTVELQIYESQTGCGSLAAKLSALRKLDAVGRRLYAGVPDLAGIRHGVNEVGRERRLATGKLNGHLPPRFNLEGVVHDLFDLFPREFMDITHLVGIHETGIAH